MKIINPLDNIQTSYTKENLIRYIDANIFIENALSNNKNLLYIFQESEKVLGYMISPAYLVHYCTIIQNITMNNCLKYRDLITNIEDKSGSRSYDPDIIKNEVYSNYNEFLFLKKMEKTSGVKIYDIFMSFNDNKLTKDTITSFLKENIYPFSESYCVLNIIKADDILNKGYKNLTLSQFRDVEILLATMKKTFPTFFQLSQKDVILKNITKDLKDIHEQLCIYCQEVIASSHDELKKNLLKDIFNNDDTNKMINSNKEPLTIEKIAKKLSPSDKINNMGVIKELVMEEKTIKNLLYSFEAIALELFPEKKFEVIYIDEDALTTHLFLKDKNTSKERIFFNINEYMIQNQYKNKITKGMFKKKEKNKTDKKDDRKDK